MTKAEKTSVKYITIPTMAILTLLIIVAICSFSLWGIARIHYAVVFGQDCGGYLARAKDTIDFEEAANDIQTAIEYLEKKGLDHGVIKIFREYPDNDLSFFHRNLIEARDAFRASSSDSELEKLSLLQRMDEQLRIPCGISIHGNNLTYFWWSIISLISFFVLLIVRMLEPEDINIPIRVRSK